MRMSLVLAVGILSGMAAPAAAHTVDPLTVSTIPAAGPVAGQVAPAPAGGRGSRPGPPRDRAAAPGVVADPARAPVPDALAYRRLLSPACVDAGSGGRKMRQMKESGT